MVTLILLALAGITNAIMDTIAFRYESSTFSRLNPKFWNPKESWKNKYKNPNKFAEDKWYYFKILQPKYQEKFLYSSSIFVSFTDAWHLFQKLLWTLMIGSTILYTPMVGIWDFFIFYGVFTGSFSIFYYLFNKTEPVTLF